MTQADFFEQNPKLLGGSRTLTDKDLEDFGEAERRIYALMNDGQWHTATTIIVASRQREGLRRLRSFRQKGVEVESRRTAENSREFEYRLK